jgi:hypothetical protein
MNNPNFASSPSIELSEIYDTEHGNVSPGIIRKQATKRLSPVQYSSFQASDEEDTVGPSANELLVAVRNLISAPFFSLTPRQRTVTIGLFDHILRKGSKKDFSLSFTDEDEVQLYRKTSKGNLYLLVDEYGGIAFNLIGRPGQGASASYFDDDKVDTRKIIQIAHQFIRLT